MSRPLTVAPISDDVKLSRADAEDIGNHLDAAIGRVLDRSMGGDYGSDECAADMETLHKLRLAQILIEKAIGGAS